MINDKTMRETMKEESNFKQKFIAREPRERKEGRGGRKRKKGLLCFSL